MLLRLMSEKGKYDTVYFAFVDILGFKNILQTKCKNNPNYLLRILSEADAASHRDQFYGVKKIYLSDSILMWTKHRSAIPYLFENCENIQKYLFLKGHLVRGVIVKGKHYTGNLGSLETKLGKEEFYPDHILVSPVLVKAYLQEQAITQPVIKAEGAVLNDYPAQLKSGKAKKKRYQNNKLYFGRDYVSHFSYIYTLLGSKDKSWDKELKKEFGHILKLRKMITSKLKSPKGSARNKWIYVANRFNGCLKLIDKKLKAKKLDIPKIVVK
jgi:hypothetical protein